MTANDPFHRFDRSARKHSRPRYCFWMLAVLAIVISTNSALAQRSRESDAFLNQQRGVRDQIWEQIDREMPATQKVDFDFGGNYSFNLFLYDDGIDSSRTLRRNDLRLWARMAFDQGAHEIYARARLSFLDFNTGDSYDGNDDDWNGPNLERGYYQFDLKRAMRAYANREIDFNLKAKIGRDLVEFGTGLALSDILDHVAVTYSDSEWELTGLAGKTVGSSQDFDLTRPTSRTRRAVFGTQLRYLGFEKHRPFAYVLWQSDHNHETRPTPLQDYDYDSVYVGLGSTGELTKNLFYSTEWVYEGGRSYGHRDFYKRDVIKAWAFDIELEYLFDVPKRPRVSAEYIFASGDPDRLASPTDASGGNRGDMRDSSFVGLGYRDTGLSFAPRLSNVHIWRMGGSFFPLAGDPTFDRLELGTNWFLYWKNRRDGAVSDPTADMQSGYLGWEMDYYASWAITTDLSWTARYGLFFPGDAFSDQSSRSFFLTGMTWSF